MSKPCSSCGKLAGLEVGEPEVEDVAIDTGVITAHVHLIKTSACCGDDMKEYTFELDSDISETLEAHLYEDHNELKPTTPEGQAVEVPLDDFSVVDDSVEATERTVDSNSKGKTIKPRYRKSYTGVELTVTVTCDREDCDWTHEVTLADDVPNSSFEEM